MFYLRALNRLISSQLILDANDILRVTESHNSAVSCRIMVSSNSTERFICALSDTELSC